MRGGRAALLIRAIVMLPLIVGTTFASRSTEKPMDNSRPDTTFHLLERLGITQYMAIVATTRFSDVDMLMSEGVQTDALTAEFGTRIPRGHVTKIARAIQSIRVAEKKAEDAKSGENPAKRTEGLPTIDVGGMKMAVGGISSVEVLNEPVPNNARAKGRAGRSGGAG